MSNYKLGKKIVSTSSPAGTKSLAKKIASGIIKKGLQDKAVILALFGDLGSGKTTFIQGLANGLGIKDKITSPTFVIMKSFRIQVLEFKRFYHFDCYRLKNEKDVLALGWQEIIADPRNIVAIEWPEKIKNVLPKETIYLNFKFINPVRSRDSNGVNENQRKIKSWKKIKI